jgi:hypothetical protein
MGIREARLTDPDENEVRVGSPLREAEPAAQAVSTGAVNAPHSEPRWEPPGRTAFEESGRV